MVLLGLAGLLVGADPAAAHGLAFGVSHVSVAPDDGATVWAVVDGWGVVGSRDAGATWSWVCEEALGDSPVLAVLARTGTREGHARAWVGTRAGILALDDACSATLVPGLPPGSYVAALAQHPLDASKAIVLATGPQGGVYDCVDTGCVATGLVGEGMYPKSVIVDESGAAWVTTVAADTLEATLWRAAPASSGAEPSTWEARARWPDGNVDPRVLEVRGERVLLWERTRAEGDTPRLVRSEDGGATWTQVLAHGTWTYAAPGLLRVGETVLLGSVLGARTWRSADDGRSWTDASLTLPAVRCGVVTRDPASGPDAPPRVWTCGDHLADGFDLATSTDLATWAPVACLQQAQVATCAESACTPFVDLYAEAGALGGDACEPDTGGAVDASPGCSCAVYGAVGAPTRRPLPLLAALGGVAVTWRRARGARPRVRSQEAMAALAEET
jgi:hypothetical protein